MGDSHPTDAELLSAVRRSPDAFGRFYDRYERAVAGYFVKRVGTADVAADLTAEVFARVLESAHRYRAEQSTAAPWLFTIAHNTLITSIRQGHVEAVARRRLGLSRIELDEQTLARIDAANGEVWVRELLDGLPSDQREAIIARVLDERDYADIARDLDTSELVIRKRVSRGLAQLRNRLGRST